MKTVYVMTCFSALALGCGGSDGTRPHDMSVAQHEQAAAQEKAAAEQAPPTVGTRGLQPKTGPSFIRWTARDNPNAEQAGTAGEHRKAAAAHREAAQALRDAEASACAGLSDEDRDESPFFFKADVASVEVLVEPAPGRGGKSSLPEKVGAAAVFRAVPGLTAEWMQRLVDCHLARAAAVGHQMPDMSYCPLVLRGVTAKVTSAGGGFRVEVRSDDPKTVAEIIRRVNAHAVTK
jgi:hypothetical protein